MFAIVQNKTVPKRQPLLTVITFSLHYIPYIQFYTIESLEERDGKSGPLMNYERKLSDIP